MSYVITGRVIKPFGVEGWVKVEVLSANPHRYRKGGTFLLEGREKGERLFLEAVRKGSEALLVKFRGFDNRRQAEELKGKKLLVNPEEIGEPPGGSLWEHQVIGLEVRILEDEYLGKVVEIIETGANDVMVVRGEKEYFIPLIEEVVADVDLDAGLMIITPLPGLLEL